MTIALMITELKKTWLLKIKLCTEVNIVNKIYNKYA